MAGGGEREREREGADSRQSKREDRPVWQVYITVHSPSCKADGKKTQERKELGHIAASIITQCGTSPE